MKNFLKKSLIVAGFLAVSFSSAWATNTTLPLLSAGSAVTSGDLLLTRQGSNTSDSKITVDQLKTFMSASPTLVTPALGTPASGVLTNATGYLWANIVGGTNTTAAIVVGTGASIAASGSGTITATAVPASGLTGATLASSVTASSIPCAGLSNGATGCSTATGTSGATIPLLNGANSYSAGQIGVPVTVSISTATFTPNLAAGNNFNITLVHASCPCTLANPTNIVAGQSGVIVINQSATGSDLINTYGTDYVFTNAAAPVLSTGVSAVDQFAYYVVDSTHIRMSFIGSTVSTTGTGSYVLSAAPAFTGNVTSAGDISQAGFYRVILTSSTSWTSPAWAVTGHTVFRVTTVGGGGAGGVGSGTTVSGGGGGSGAVCSRDYTTIAASTAYTYAVGPAGSSSTFSDGVTTLTATTGAVGGTNAIGGAAGTCTNQNSYGLAMPGESGPLVGGVASSSGLDGGGNMWGQGGKGVASGNGTTASLGCGGGGSGAPNGSTGGAGATGCVIIEAIH